MFTEWTRNGTVTNQVGLAASMLIFILQDFPTLGDSIMRSMYVVFNLDNGQISIAQAAVNTTAAPDVVTVAAGPGAFSPPLVRPALLRRIPILLLLQPWRTQRTRWRQSRRRWVSPRQLLRVSLPATLPPPPPLRQARLRFEFLRWTWSALSALLA